MIDCLIVAGGEIDRSLLKREVEDKRNSLYIIAADRGLSGLKSVGVLPNEIIGDFDSCDEETLNYANKLASEGVSFTRLNPIKDDTDTEAALHLAFEKSDGVITILGGTGSRLDHVLANLNLLCQGLEKDRSVILKNSTNRIRVIDKNHPITIKKSEQYGRYLSLLPFGNDAEGVTAKGVFYPLQNERIPANSSLGASNEIISDEAEVSISEGRLFIIESMD